MRARRPRTTAWLVGVMSLASSLLLVGGTGSADATDLPATLTAAGWWWQAQAGLPAPLPPPPNVQKGQLYVQGASSDGRGAAFSAVRYTLAPGRTVQSLTLRTANDPGAPVVLVACRTGSAWVPAEAGTWSAAPKVDTAACVNGQKAADGASWLFPVGTLQVDDVLDVAVVPGLDPTTNTQAPFAVSFEAPTNEAVTTIDVAPPTVPSPPTLSAIPDASPSSFQTLLPVATGLPADKVGQTATAPTREVATRPQLDPTPITPAASTRDKRLGYLLFVLVAAVGLYAWRRDVLMASGDGGELRGLGRFTRTRDKQPHGLT
ncbi:MAG: hypothetical protein QOE35_2104 [Actinomycetota bacterium]|jgi:hypothetical protein